MPFDYSVGRKTSSNRRGLNRIAPAISGLELLEPRKLLASSQVVVPDGPDLPRSMTAAEREYLKDHPLAGESSLVPTAAPAGPIDPVAEYDRMEGLVISWVGSTSFLNILAQITRRVTVDANSRVYIGRNTSTTVASINTTLTSAGANLSNVTIFTVGLNSIWARDYGPRYVYEGDIRVITDHRYNRNRPLDDAQPATFGNLKQNKYYEIGLNGNTLIHGGGNYHLATNGDAYATSLITDENPSFTSAQVQQIWNTYQANNTTITGEFPLSVDATGHIDMWMQIYDDQKVFISDWPSNPGSTQDVICDTTATLMQSRGYQVTRIPAYLSGGTHYTFANMVICNNVVSLPQYNNGPGATISATTLATVQAAFGPSKTVFAINADAIVTSAGVFHCIVQHIPIHKGVPGANGGLAPTAYLSGLNGGQTLLAGQSATITWISDDDAPVASSGGVMGVDLLLSLNGGATYPIPLATNLPAAGSYNWTVPTGINSTAARVKAVARDGQNNTGQDSSDANFTLGLPDVPTPATGLPILATQSDTGLSESDGLTNLNNSSASTRLTFNVIGTVAGNTVRLFAGNVLIATQVATGITTQLVTDGSTIIADASYAITSRQTEPGRPESTDSPLGLISVDTASPFINLANFAVETEQRVDLVPSEVVQLTAATLTNQTTGQTLGNSELVVTPNGATISVRKSTGLLADGNWRLTTNAADLTDAAGNVSSATFGFDFFVLAGDANRDRSVNFSDLVVLASNYNQPSRTFSQANFDYSADGVVGFNDLVIFAQRYNTSLFSTNIIDVSASKRSQGRVADQMFA